MRLKAISLALASMCGFNSAANASSQPLVVSEALLQQCRTSGLAFDASQYFGVVAHLPLGDSALAREQRKFRLELLNQLKINHTREDILWDRIEPAKGVFETLDFANMIAETHNAAVDILPILAYGNRLYNKNPADDIYRPPFPLNAYEPFIDQAFNLLQHNEHVYEIWNEPNAGPRFWKSALLGDAKQYGDLLKMAANRIRQHDPEAKILIGGLFSASTRVSIGLVFLKELYRYHPDIGEYYDYLSWHPYRYPHNAPEISSLLQFSLAEELQSLKLFFQQTKVPAKKIWLTEIGWNTAQWAFPPGVSYTDQANFLVRSMMIALAAGIERYYWYELTDGPAAHIFSEHGFGLYGSDHNLLKQTPSPKPAFFALKQFVEKLTPYDRILDLSNTWQLGNSDHAYLVCSSADEVFLVSTWTTGKANVDMENSKSRRLYTPSSYAIDMELLNSSMDDSQATVYNGYVTFLPAPTYYLGKKQTKMHSAEF